MQPTVTCGHGDTGHSACVGKTLHHIRREKGGIHSDRGKRCRADTLRPGKTCDNPGQRTLIACGIRQDLQVKWPEPIRIAIR